MSTLSSLLVQSGQPVAGPDSDRGRSASGAVLELLRLRAVDRPVDLATVLKRHGLTLREAHATLDDLVADRPTAVTLNGSQTAIIADLAALGVLVRPLQNRSAAALAAPHLRG